MKHTNYPNLLKIIINRNKGFWRIEAIGRLSKKINQGYTQLEYLKNLITRHEKQNKMHSFLQVNPLNTCSKKESPTEKARSRSSQTFFVTQIPPFNRRRLHNYNDKLFMSEFEENIYNPIELHPFEIKYMRQRDENQKYFNVQEIKKEIEKNYNYIRNEQIKNRPFSSYYKSKMNKDFFGYEKKKSNINSNISINNYYSNNRNMSKKRKKGYKINKGINKYNNERNTINGNWGNSQEKKRIISAYLNNKMKGNIFGEENELFENIKKNKTLMSNFSTKNKTFNDFSTITNNSNFLLNKTGLSEKLINLNDITKAEINKRIFSSINSENRNNKNYFYDIKHRNKNRIKSAKINKNIILNHGKIAFNQKHYNNANNKNYKDNNYNSILFRNEKSDIYINKKSKVIKIK